MEKLLYNEIGPNGAPYKKGEWKDFAIQNDFEIKGFFGEYRFLSNFGPAKVFLDDVEYSSVELAYQAAKWKPENRSYFLTCTPLESIDYNRKNLPDMYSHEQWDAKKFDIMRDLIKQKFDWTLNPENYEKLKATGNKHLEEMNWWGDSYWGTDKNGNGENNLGKILMEIRDSINQ